MRILIRRRRPAVRAAALAGALLSLCVVFAPSAMASAVSTPNVSLTNDLAGQVSQYTIEFTPVSEIEPGTTITLAAPAGTVFPSSEYDYTIYTLVDGYTYSGYTILNPPQLADGGSDVTLTVNSATTIPGGQDMEVVIGGVGNASSAGAQELSVATTGDGTPSLSNPFQLVADPATSLSVVAGSPSSGQVGQAFSGPFEVEATDEYGNPVSGVSVTFAAPSSGPSGLLPTGAFPYGLSTDTVTTGSDGIASSDPFTADYWVGSYDVQATANGLSPVELDVSNLPGPATSVLDDQGDGQSAQVGTAYGLPLEVQVTDEHGNPVPDTSVQFTTPSSGPSATFANGTNTDTETTNAEGYATSTGLTADSTPGSFEVTVTVPGTPGAQTIVFGLTNNPAKAAAAKITLTLSPRRIRANGRSHSVLIAKVTDQQGDPVDTDTVTFASSGGQLIGPVTDDGNGVYTAVLRSTGQPGRYKLVATDTSWSAPVSASQTLTQFRW